MSERALQNFRRGLTGLSLVLCLTGASRCSSDASDPQACVQLGLEQFERLESARNALDPWHQELVAARQSRGLASIETPASQKLVPEPYLSGYDRDGWAEWARVRLKEVENTIDAVPVHDRYLPARAALTELAKEIVEFHAYVERGRVSRMIRLLDQMKETSQRATELACSPRIANSR